MGQPFCSVTVHKWLSTEQSGSAILFSYSSKWLSAEQSGSAILFTYSSQMAVCCADWVSHFVHLQFQMALYCAEWASHFVYFQFKTVYGTKWVSHFVHIQYTNGCLQCSVHGGQRQNWKCTMNGQGCDRKVSRGSWRNFGVACLQRPGPPLWSSGQSFWLQIQRSRVR